MADDDFSLVRGDWPFRVQRALGLVPADGSLGIGRRIVFLVVLTWLPVAGWALVTARALPGHVNEPLLEHFGVHARCLVAIPLFLVTEATLHGMSRQLVPYFVSSGLVAVEEVARFRTIVSRLVTLRDAYLPWVLIAGVVIAWMVTGPISTSVHELVWAEELTPTQIHLGFGGWWFFYVSRPIYLALLLGFVWRIVMLGIFLRRVARLPLSIVPSHPDRAGGLAFLEYLPLALSPGVLAISVAVASRWAHDVAFHGADLLSLRMPAAVLLASLALIALFPLSAFSGPLRRARFQALLDYGALVGEHGRRVRRRWILKEEVQDPESLLAAPELGPVADTVSLYEAVGRMRAVPVGKLAFAAVLVPAVLPMIAVAAIRIPVKDIVLKVLHAVA